MEALFKLRCRRCRCLVLTDRQLINTHSEPLGTSDMLCSSKSTSSVWYISMEIELFPWIQEAVTQAAWTKGKLYCPKCNGRIGSFDFINSSQCPCGRETLPGVHILCDRVDKIDISKQDSVRHQSPRPNLLLNGSLQFIGGEVTSGCRQQALDKSCVKINTMEEAVTVCLKPTDEPPNLSVSDIPSRGRRDNNRTLDATCDSSHALNSLRHIQSPTNHYNCDILPEHTTTTQISHLTFPKTGNNLETSGERLSETDAFDAKKPDTNLSGVSMATSEAPINIRQRQRLRKDHQRRRRLRTGGDEFGLIWDRELKEEVNRFHLLVQEEQDETTEDTDPLEDIEDDHMCPVCLDVYLHPHVCLPCQHMFCESCLRQLAQKSDNSTRFYCPMCREPILNCELRQELSEELKSLYPLTYEYRLVIDRKYLAHRFRLPRSIGLRRPQPSMQSQFMWAVSRSHWGLVYMTKHMTLLATIVLLILVLCVSMVL